MSNLIQFPIERIKRTAPRDENGEDIPDEVRYGLVPSEPTSNEPNDDDPDVSDGYAAWKAELDAEREATRQTAPQGVPVGNVVIVYHVVVISEGVDESPYVTLETCGVYQGVYLVRRDFPDAYMVTRHAVGEYSASGRIADGDHVYETLPLLGLPEPR